MVLNYILVGCPCLPHSRFKNGGEGDYAFGVGSFSSFPSFRSMGEIKKIKCLAAKTAFSLENNKPVTVAGTIIGSPVESSRKNVEIAKDYKLMNCSPIESFPKNVKMAKSSGVASSVHNENAKVREFQRLIQIDRVSNWSRFADKC